MGAVEWAQWLKAAWKPMGGWCSWTRWARTLRFLLCTPLSPRGQKASCSGPRNRGPNTTLLSSMTFEDMGTSLAVECATDREVFETYVERVLVPTLGCGQQGVVMGNLTTCKGEGKTDERGARLPARLHAGLLCGSQPHRGGVLEDQGTCA